MAKTVIFVVLLLLAAGFFVVDALTHKRIIEEFWSEAFWVIVGAVVTIFVLEKLLEAAEHRRRRAGDKFAFRTFCADVFEKLYAIAGCPPEDASPLFERALGGGAEFQNSIEEAVNKIQERSHARISGPVYNHHYINVAEQLRRFSLQYIRLFAKSDTEMVRVYRKFQNLADKWKYKDALSEGYEKRTDSSANNDAIKQELEKQTKIEEGDAKKS